ncbi:unnamed protein product [Blepharisma stoltei]|uniref:Protein RER1 n=1 Tax=Blepharisma stoltei TaxID=1481888 RepID=A0AAU9JNV8_9CILI|nr:unnamed protein product [Blepharisma stoltei]
MEDLGFKGQLRIYMQTYTDRISPHIRKRWLATCILLLIFFQRVISLQGYYVVAYCLAIFILNLFLRFLTPIMSDMEDEESDNPVLPMRETNEYKPFIRKLGEFSFWKNTLIGTLISIICTFIEALNFEIFWPVLVIYFLVLFVATMRRQIAHMYKHGYIPFDFGKEKYNSQREKTKGRVE